MIPLWALIVLWLSGVIIGASIAPFMRDLRAVISAIKSKGR